MEESLKHGRVVGSPRDGTASRRNKQLQRNPKDAGARICATLLT